MKSTAFKAKKPGNGICFVINAKINRSVYIYSISSRKQEKSKRPVVYCSEICKNNDKEDKSMDENTKNYDLIITCKQRSGRRSGGCYQIGRCNRWYNYFREGYGMH